MAEPLRVLSLGAGVQSTTLLLMVLEGEFGEDAPTCAIFADTGWEPKAVYAHLEWLEGIAREKGFPIYRVSAGNIREKALQAANGDPLGFVDMPLIARLPGEAPQMLQRQCTNQFKIRPMRQRLAEMVSEKSPGSVELWRGISADEIIRAKDADVKWIVHRHPLVQRGMTREGCISWLLLHDYPIPPKSSCIGCPFHDNDLWQDMKDKSPEEWEDAVAFDNAVRHLPRVDGEVFIHSSAVPLADANLRPRRRKTKGQLDFGFGNECEGMCGV